MSSGVARPGPTRACALPSTSQALPSPTQLESRDSTTNQTKVKNTYISCCANRYRLIVYIMLQYNSDKHSLFTTTSSLQAGVISSAR